MSDIVTFTQKKDQITDQLNSMLDRTQTIQGYFERVVFRQFQKAQIERWKSQNASEGDTWRKLTPMYAKRKLKRFAAYDGGGRVVMIATGKLSQGAMGRDTSGYYKVVTNQGITVGINLSAIPYAGYASEKRPTMKFSRETLNNIKDGIKAFIAKGEERYEG